MRLKMKVIAPIFFIIVCFSIVQISYAEENYLSEGYLVNPASPWNLAGEPLPQDNPITLTAGGNIPVSADTNNEPIIFQIGYPFPSNAGFPEASAILKAEAETMITAGSLYRYGPDGQTGIGEGAWNIRFEGVLNQFDGQPWVSSPGDEQNYFEEKILEAERLYRAALSVNPFDTEASGKPALEGKGYPI